MLRKYCMVCNDVKKFKMKDNDIKRITSHMRGMKVEKLENISRKVNSDIELKRIAHSVRMNKPTVRFMCGHCSKVNNQELDRAFHEFKDLYIHLIVSLMNTNDKDYFTSTKHKLIRLLRGFFPSCVRQLERISFKDELDT